MTGHPSQKERPRSPALLVGMVATVLLSTAIPETEAARIDQLFEDPLFKRCIGWLLDGNGGALIENLCVDDYALPSPGLFLCARKVMIGFPTASDQEGCALLFEEQTKKIRAGYVK